MPLKSGKENIGQNIAELHKGPQYARTAAKHGKGVANRQAVAIAMEKVREGPRAGEGYDGWLKRKAAERKKKR